MAAGDEPQRVDYLPGPPQGRPDGRVAELASLGLMRLGGRFQLGIGGGREQERMDGQQPAAGQGARACKASSRARSAGPSRPGSRAGGPWSWSPAIAAAPTRPARRRARQPPARPAARPRHTGSGYRSR